MRAAIRETNGFVYPRKLPHFLERKFPEELGGVRDLGNLPPSPPPTLAVIRNRHFISRLAADVRMLRVGSTVSSRDRCTRHSHSHGETSRIGAGANDDDVRGGGKRDAGEGGNEPGTITM